MLKFYKKDGKLLVSEGLEFNLEQVLPNTVDAAKEKHVPEVEINGNLVKVSVGSVIHPMLDNHYIEFILLETNKGVYKKNLKPGEEPVVGFVLDSDEKALNVFELCNLHGLWKKEL